MKPTIYIGCSLTQSPQSFRDNVEQLKRNLSAHYEVLDFLGLKKGSPADVYQWDIERNVKGCDLFVAICDYPAIGLGYEIATAVERFHKPVLAVAQEGALITRMLEGIPHDLYSFKQYRQLSEVPMLIEDKFKQLKRNQEPTA